MRDPLHIVVMLGGPSAEREISLCSGQAVAEALRGIGHRVTELDPQRADWRLPAGTDVVFLALHGAYGEDGTVQEQLETLGVPYTGCDPAASRLAFDKIATKRVCLEKGIPTPRFEVLGNASAPWPSGWNPPVVLKPSRQGSSVGLQFVRRQEDWAGALNEVFQHDSEVLLEEMVAGRETTVGILDGIALPIVEVRPKEGAYDYRNKYTNGATDYFCPADFNDQIARRIKEAAWNAFLAVGGRDYGRVDIMVRPHGEPMVLEVNTLPGMTEMSLLPKAAAAAGISYAELCQKMIDLALLRGSSPSGNQGAPVG
jgi:D-alanine-D-alanine ligase